MSELVDIVPVKPAPPKGLIPPGSVLSVIMPGQWVLYIAPDHPCYSDVLRAQLEEWPTRAIQEAGFLREGLPAITRLVVSNVLMARGVPLA